MSSHERDRLRDAFDRAYGARYDRPGLEDRIMANAMDRRPGDRRPDGPRLLAAGAVALAVAGAVVVVLLALGRATPPPVPAGPIASASTSPAPTANQEQASPATPQPGSTGAGPGGACAVSQLGLRAGRTTAATSHTGTIFTFRNQSHVACTLEGFPGLQMLDGQGRPLPTSVNWGTDYVVHAERPALVTLAPGGEASFVLGTESPGAWGLTCPTSVQLEVTPPDETHRLVIAFAVWSAESADPAGGQPQCGRFTVSPVYPGSGDQP
jgi:hypothetical protein